MSPGSRPNVHLTLAIGDYDHVRDLVSGAVPVQGIDLTCMSFSVEETFFRFARHREWDISEFSLAKYCSLRASGDDSVTAIPIFPSRTFRHSAIFVRADGPVNDAAALAGGRIGVPEWTQTATVYVRGLLQHGHGVDPAAVHWFQGGTNEPGRIEGIAFEPPEGIEITPVRDRSLNDMLLAGELDAVIAAHPPAEFEHGTGRVVRLFSDPRAEEERYYRDTGIFPIMHVVALRSDVLERHPWAAMNLYTAFEEAKRRSLARATDFNAPRYPIPWSPANAARAQELFGPDFWPYGIENNQITLDAFLTYAHEQGVCARRLTPTELFASQVTEQFRISRPGRAAPAALAERRGRTVGLERHVEVRTLALVDRRDQVLMDLQQQFAVEAGERDMVDVHVQVVDQHQVHAAQRRIAAQPRDLAMQGVVGLEECARIVAGGLHLHQHPLEGADVGHAVVTGGVVGDQGLERVADLQAFGIAGGAGGEAEHGVAESQPCLAPSHEHAAARARSGLDHTAGLEQPHRLVDRGHGDAEAQAQILLGAEAVAGRALFADLPLELTRHQLGSRDAYGDVCLGRTAHRQR